MMPMLVLRLMLMTLPQLPPVLMTPLPLVVDVVSSPQVATLRSLLPNPSAAVDRMRAAAETVPVPTLPKFLKPLRLGQPMLGFVPVIGCGRRLVSGCVRLCQAAPGSRAGGQCLVAAVQCQRPPGLSALA